MYTGQSGGNWFGRLFWIAERIAEQIGERIAEAMLKLSVKDLFYSTNRHIFANDALHVYVEGAEIAVHECH